MVEDPATGAAAAALGGYLRVLDQVPGSRTIHVRQGEELGRPSRLRVEIPAKGGLVISGNAVHLD